MARALSDLEYVTFLDDVQPDSLGLPDWGAIVQWGGEFVLAFKMPSGEWALSDVTGGIPYGSTVIPIQTYIANVPRTQAGPLQTFIYSLAPESMATAAQALASVQALGSGAAQYTAQQVADAFSKLIGGVSTGLGPALIPLAAIAVAVLVLMYGRK